MIERVEIQWQEYGPKKIFKLNNDLNIFTGKNGCGKTTTLKLLWYVISNNFTQIVKEIDFYSIAVYKNTTDYYRLKCVNENVHVSINVKGIDSSKTFLKEKRLYLEVKSQGGVLDGNFTLEELQTIKDFPEVMNVFDLFKTSLFLPTFRRIEGGFDIEHRNEKNFSLKDNLSKVSSLLSNNQHKFVTSVSTDDIEVIINKKYAEIAFENNSDLELRYSNFKTNNSTKENIDDFYEKFIRLNYEKNLEKFKSFNAFNSAIIKLLGKKHIKIGNISIGDAKSDSIIKASSLSSGEKQLLGFLSYNFFYENTIIFIDEPELSLHADWQRIMFRVLLKQNNGNQFIITTHSPFIYSRFPEKEFILDKDKGE